MNQAVVPAAGLGTRLRPLTNTFPKEMLPIGRLPVLAHVVQELREAGITRALFVVSEAKPQIRGYFGDTFTGDNNKLPPLECSYNLQLEQRGLGHAIGLAREWTEGEPFAVAFGDCIIESTQVISPLQRLIALHTSSGSCATTLVEAVAPERVSRYGIVQPKAKYANELDLELDDIIEKPQVEEAPSNLAVAARWVLDPGIFDVLDRTELDSRGEINLTDAVRSMKLAGGALWATKLRQDEARRDIGNFGSFFDAFVLAAMRDTEYGLSVRKTVQEELERG